MADRKENLKMSEYLFSYGTLQQEKTQLELFGRILKGSVDTLQGYKIVTVEITDKTFLTKGESKFQKTLIHTGNKNDSIKGTFLEISYEELLLVDQYEPDNYKRIQVILESGKKSWIYIAV